MKLFSSDLDNTLIYSYKHDIGPDKVCVEVYEGRQVSFMRREWIQSLGRIGGKMLFVPVTTRSLEQYRRLDLKIGPIPYALVCNGGALLKDGREDPDWYEESLKLIKPSGEEMHRALELLEKDSWRKLDVRFIQKLFIFTKSSRPEESCRRLREQLDHSKVQVFQNGEKVYVLPQKLDKGTGIMRLKSALQAEQVFAAGDSEFDRPMILRADTGICPEGLIEEAKDSVLQFPREVFTSSMLKTLEEL